MDAVHLISLDTDSFPLGQVTEVIALILYNSVIPLAKYISVNNIVILFLVLYVEEGSNITLEYSIIFSFLHIQY